MNSLNTRTSRKLRFIKITVNNRGEKDMGIEMIIGLAIGMLFIWCGYIIRTKKTFVFLAGFMETWVPVNKERLGNRIGILVMTLGIIAIFTSIFTIWFEATAGKISGVLAIINVILMIIVIGLDQMGY